MVENEKTQLLKDLIVETRKLSASHVSEKIPEAEREAIRNEFVAIAERMIARYGLPIPDVRRVLHELLDVSV